MTHTPILTFGNHDCTITGCDTATNSVLIRDHDQELPDGTIVPMITGDQSGLWLPTPTGYQHVAHVTAKAKAAGVDPTLIAALKADGALVDVCPACPSSWESP